VQHWLDVAAKQKTVAITLRELAPFDKRLGTTQAAYEKAFAEEIGIYGSSYTNTMMVELGERLYFAKGSDKNIKLTTKDDLEIFKGYLTAEKDKWLK
jgi:2-C-methyl-D-erythritol 4-phosphate cytidylyltransferase